MKAIKSKKLHKRINTVCDFNLYNSNNRFFETTVTTGTDPTNTTATSITTVNTGITAKC
jgi:hypothetical protein